MNKLYIHIKSLIGIENQGITFKKGLEMKNLEQIENAWLYTENDIIMDFGMMNDQNIQNYKNTETIECENQFIIPCFVDSHTHLVFAASREEEFMMRLHGATYIEIAEAGGGILNSAEKLGKMSEDELYESAWKRLMEVISLGTGAIEIKSGYGLSTESEIKILRVIKRLKENSPIAIKATFLGAHAIPSRHVNNRENYIKEIVEEMLPIIVKENLCDYMDVFCDKGFFTTEETDYLLKEAAKYHLKAKIHGNELGITGGIQVAVANNALSVDHLEYMDEEEIICLKNSQTFPVALPNCSFFLRLPYAPARRIIDNDLPFVLASDYNPGSSPSGDMRLVWTLACTQMKITPEEALNACTINGAAAIELSDVCGSISKGKKANFIITQKIPSLAYIPYAFGSKWIDKVIINGKEF